MERNFIRVLAPVFSILLWVLFGSGSLARAGDGSGVSGASGGEVVVSATANRTLVSPGDQVVVAVVFDHKPGWHVQANEEALDASSKELVSIPTTIGVTPPAGVKAGPIQWPKPKMLSAAALGNDKAVVPVFEGRAVAFVPLVVDAGVQPGSTLSIVLEVGYQACDDKTCLFPVDEKLTAALTVRAAGDATPAPPTDAALFAGFDTTVFAKMAEGLVQDPAKAKDATLSFNFFGRTVTVGTTGVGFLALLGLAALGGFLLNLTPCVLPVIPIKMMTLQASAGHAGRRVLLGWVMCFGVVGFWLAIGAAIAFVSGFNAISQLFQYSWFGIAVGVIIAIMGVGMLGVFTVNLPQWVYAIDPKNETVPGSFLFGIMTAVLSTPCTAPFMGTAATWAVGKPAVITLGVFAAIGAGMALPYLVLALFPVLVSKVPRAGAAGELVKQVMGILMLAVAAFFVGNGIDPLTRLPIDPPSRWHWWLAAGLVALAGVWMAWRTVQITKRVLPRVVWSLVGVGLVVVGYVGGKSLTDRGPIDWVGYTPERLAEAKAAGKVVVIDFTAEWCFNCKALEKGVLHQGEVVRLFKEPGIAKFKVDLTGNNEPGQAKLKSLNWVGIPLLVVDGPGVREPLKFDTYTVGTVVEAVRKARGS